MTGHVLLIAGRINRQFLRDRRFLGLSLVVPVLLIVLLKYVIDSLPGLIRLGANISEYSVLLAAFLVHFLAYVLATIVLVRDRNTGTLERMFVSGYRRSEIVMGYVAGYSTIAVAQTAIVLILTRLLFHVRIERDLAAVVLTMLALAVVSVGLGVFVSNFARNEGQVFPFIPLVTIPSGLLSGVAIPVEDLPRVLQWISNIVPLTWAARVLKPVIVKKESFLGSLPDFLVLLGFGVLLLALASLTLRESE
ncbi:MAG: ABC transporter permease [Gaiellales bacterium]|nr:MAG: ABC transporter permease [Gaiellales bacterium]